MKDINLVEGSALDINEDIYLNDTILFSFTERDIFIYPNQALIFILFLSLIFGLKLTVTLYSSYIKSCFNTNNITAESIENNIVRNANQN